MGVTIVEGKKFRVEFAAKQGLPGLSVPAGGDVGQVLVKISGSDYDYVWRDLTKEDVDLNNVDNTADLDKLVSLATQAAIAAAASGVYPIVLTPAAMGAIVTLENATGLSIGTTRSYKNNSEFDITVKNFVGDILGFIPAFSTAIFTCENITTPSGVWNILGLNVLGITQEKTGVVNFGGSTATRSFVLDADRIAFLISGASIYLKVYNKTTNEWSSDVLIRSGIANGSACNLSLDSANTLLIGSFNSTTGMELVTVSLSGANGLTITVNTPVPVTLASNYTNSNPYFFKIGSTHCLAYLRSTTVVCVVGVTVSGTVPSNGTEVTLSGTTSAHLYEYSGKLLAVTASSTFVYAMPFTVTGNTLTAGTETSFACANIPFKTHQNGGRVFVFYTNASSANAAVIDIVATVASNTTVTLLASGSVSDVVPISATKILVAIAVSNSSFNFVHVIDTVGVVSIDSVSTINNGAAGSIFGISTSSNISYFECTGVSNSRHVFKVDSTSSPSVTLISSTNIGGGNNPPTVAATQSYSLTPSVKSVESTFGTIVPANISYHGSKCFKNGRVRLVNQLPINNFLVAGHTSLEIWSANNDSGHYCLQKVECAK